MAKKNWIKGAIKRPGEFTRKAKERGMTVSQFMNAVQKNPKKYDSRTVRQANLAKTLRSMQAGGAYQNTTLPMSTSTMAAMPGQEQAQQQFQQLQAESRRAQRMNERAEELERQALKDEATQELNQSLTTSAPKLVNLASKARGVEGFKNLDFAGKTTGIGLGATILGAGLEKASDDQDETTLNLGEGLGTSLRGAGTGLSLAGTLSGLAPALAVPGLGLAAAGIGAGVAGIKAIRDRNEARRLQEKEDEEQRLLDLKMGRAQNKAFREGFTTSGLDMGYNIGGSQSNAYIPGYQMKMGGTKVPGGMIKPLKDGAVKFEGNSHREGGIMIDPQTEVEGGETMDQVKMKDGDNSEYVFSKFLKIGGKSFAQRHEEILRRGGSKARQQKKIQQLAQMQESVAAKNGENGRSPEKIMQTGGDKVDETYTPGEGVLTTMPTGQSTFAEGLYSQAGGFELQDTKDRNPWFDWENFDPTNAEDVKRFQQEYNDKVPKEFEVVVDGKFGDQTASIALDTKKVEAAKEEGKDVPENVEETVKSTAETETETEVETPAKKSMNMLPAAGAALLGLSQLPGKFKEGPEAAKITPQMTGRIRLPRVNFNAERAASAAGTTSVNRAIQNQVSGPAGIAATIANTEKQRQNLRNIATQEAQSNKQLMAQEAAINVNIAQQNAANVMGAQQFNEASRYNKELEDYQQKLLRREKVGDVISGIGRDFMGYRADERLAGAIDDTGSYLRFSNPSSRTTQQSKTGGYIKRSNKIRRKKRK